MGYNDDEDFDYFDEPQGNGPADLRRALKAAKQRNKELEEAVAKLTEKVTSRDLTDVLAKKGLPQGLGRFILKDDVDPSDEDAVNAWLQENQSVFNFELKPEGETESQEGDPEAGSEEPQNLEEYAQQYARMQQTSNGTLPDDRYAEARQQIKGSKSTAETQAALNRAIKNQI